MLVKYPRQGTRVKIAYRRAQTATRRLTFRRRRQLVGILLVVPSLALILSVMLYPLLYSLWISVYDLNVTTPWLPPRFVGLENYTDILKEPTALAAFGRTILFGLIGIGFGIPLAISLALALNRPFRLRGIVRALIIIPWVIPGTVQGLLWARIYDPHYGALNGLLYQLGIIREPVPWLLEPSRALFLVALVNLWATLPLMTLLYLAALQGIPQELYEAASLDGADGIRQFRYVTLPFLLPITLIVLILKTIDAFALFDIVYVLTGGGPARSTEVIGYYLFQAAFQRSDYGRASALAWLIALLTLGLAVLYRRLTLRGSGAEE
ncbi:MAG: sugar ABC transporter permease [Thermomicrobium sp.]|nr:sugar ABC transporter permease [Thermomicrobium sp.]